MYELDLKTTDIRSAFFQSKELRLDIYIKPHKESETDEGVV